MSLRVNQSTVSRRVAALEEALGVRLFERLDGAMTATRAGKAVIDEAERIEHHVLSIQERVIESHEVSSRSTERILAVRLTLFRGAIECGIKPRHP